MLISFLNQSSVTLHQDGGNKLEGKFYQVNLSQLDLKEVSRKFERAVGSCSESRPAWVKADQVLPRSGSL